MIILEEVKAPTLPLGKGVTDDDMKTYLKLREEYEKSLKEIPEDLRFTISIPRRLDWIKMK